MENEKHNKEYFNLITKYRILSEQKGKIEEIY